MNDRPAIPEGKEMPVAASDAPGSDQQEVVNAHFDAASLYWQAVYEDPSLQGAIYRARQEAVLALVDECALPAGARILEIGCGAGLLTVELARRGYAVQAVDASQAMVELTAWRARQAGVSARVQTRLVDVHAMPFDAESFDLVIAVGLLPWLHRPSQALAEIARVLRSEGGLVLTADNRARLNTFVDPRASILLAPLKRARRRLRDRAPAGATSRLHFPSHVNRLARDAGFTLERRATVGFGPFTFFSRPLLSERAGIALHERLQALADRRLPLLRSSGWHYLLKARKRRAPAVRSASERPGEDDR